jgi:hypothetical protein
VSKLLGVFFITIAVSACTWTDALKLLTPAAKSGIEADAEVTIGKKEEAINTDVQVGSNTTQEAQTITNTDSGPDGWIILLLVLLAGWAIPSPDVMFRGIRNLFRS